MLLNLPLIHYGEYFHKARAAWTPKVYACIETFEIPEADGDWNLAATGLDIGIHSRLDVFWHQEAHWIQDSNAHRSLQKEPFDPLSRNSLLFLARSRAVKDHCEGYDKVWGVYASDLWRKWAKGQYAVRGPNPRDYSASRNTTIAEERERLRELAGSLRLVDGLLFRKIETPTFAMWSSGKAELHLARRCGDMGAFCLHREKDAREFLIETFGTDEGMCEAPQVILPHSFEWDDDKASLECASMYASGFARHIRAFRNKRLEQARAGMEKAWNGLDDEGPSHEAAAKAMEDLVTAYDEAAPGTDDPEIRRISAATERWRMRPIDLPDEGSSPFRI